MLIQSQCCTLEQAKKLKELGITSPAIWAWNSYEHYSSIVLAGDNETPEYQLGHHTQNKETRELDYTNYGKYIGTYSAYSTAELGVMLPHNYNAFKHAPDSDTPNHWWIVPVDFNNHCECCSNTVGHQIEKTLSPTQAASMADALIIALENGDVTAADCNTRLNSS